MKSTNQENDLEARLSSLEEKARRTKWWLMIVGVIAFISLFGNPILRAWQINSICQDIVAENPGLDHSECMKRVQEAWSQNENTISVE